MVLQTVNEMSKIPFNNYYNSFFIINIVDNKKIYSILTSTTESLAARAKISAHETIPGHADSTAFLALSIT